MKLPYTLRATQRKQLGLIVLQADETIEDEFRQMLPPTVSLLVSRVPSGLDVTPDSLQAMETHLSAAAALFPQGLTFDAIGYACTSGSAQIGSARVAEQVLKGTQAHAVTDPVTALLAACADLGLSRLALLSPYVPSVSVRLRDVLSDAGIDTPVTGTFDEPSEARVARIAPSATHDAALTLARDAEVDGLFLSCTNLRTLDIIAPLARELQRPVLSSNLVLAWHMMRLAGADGGPRLTTQD